MSAARHVLTFFCLGILLSFRAFGQEVKVELGPDQLGINETFTIKVTLSNEKIKSYDQFPEIPGFQKQGISQSSSMNIINGQMSSSNSIIQYYKPTRKGQFTLAKFSVLINGQAAASPGKRITVTDAAASAPSGGNAFDPFADFFGRNDEIPEFVEIADDAFFAVNLDKSEVYAGEGFTMDISFFMSEQNQAADQQPIFNIQRVYLKDMSLEQPNSPAIFLEQEAPSIEVAIDIASETLAESIHEGTITTTVTAKIQDKIAFLVEGKQAGIFEVRNVPDEQLELILGISCPNILYPYLRANIADTITRAGFPPIHLNEINFEAFYQQRKQAIAESAAAKH